jgi:exopolysaccharide biosynthesis polyprenyl glycosylphosphotransferase
MSLSISAPDQVAHPPVRRILRTLPATAAALDGAVIGVSIMVAALLRESVFIFEGSAAVTDVHFVGLLMAAGWIALIGLRGGYDRDVFGAGIDEFKRVVFASALTASLVGIACYLAKYQLSRGFYLLAFVIGVPALIGTRWVLRRVLHRARRQGHLRQRTLIVGSSRAIEDVAHVLLRETWLGYEVVGALTPMTEVAEETTSGVPVLANADEAAAVAIRHEADVVILAGGGTGSASQMRQLLWELETAHVHVIVAPAVTEISSERIKIRPVGGLPLVHVEKPRAAEALSWAKRAFDVAGSLMLLLALAPLMAFLAVKVRRHDRGPVLFRQERVGRAGARFSCLKFRTMVTDAEERRAELVEELAYDASLGLFKIKDDPRITRPGRWMRRYSLDELPQLWNVLRGDMSLVGPRPPLPVEVESYDVTATRRLQVRPGMTGLWQVSGRSDLSWTETVRLDVYYVDNWSMLQDLVILARTARAVLGSSGAY